MRNYFKSFLLGVLAFTAMHYAEGGVIYWGPNGATSLTPRLYFPNGSFVDGSGGGGGSGDVVGPASATDYGFAFYDGTTGKLLKSNSFYIDGGGSVRFDGAGIYSLGLVTPPGGTIYADNLRTGFPGDSAAINLASRFLSDGTNSVFSWASATAKFPLLTSNGFLKTSGGDGTVSVDTTIYANSALSNLTNPTAVNQDLNLSSNDLNEVTNIHMQTGGLSNILGDDTSGVQLRSVSGDSGIYVDNNTMSLFALTDIEATPENNFNVESQSASGSVTLKAANGGKVRLNYSGANTVGNTEIGGASVKVFQNLSMETKDITNAGDIYANNLRPTGSVLAQSAGAQDIGEAGDPFSQVYTTSVTTSTIYDTSGLSAFTTGNRMLKDTAELDSVDASSRNLIDPDGNITLDYSSPLVVKIDAILRLPVQGAAVTPTCASGSDNGKIAITNAYIMCVCNSSSWVRVSDGSTACTF